MYNRLASENSPYLLQHKDNPVDWYPWGREALDRAILEDKPIFLSIGYAACHWCHVMAHESFEDPTTANFLNENFINIKVDREERPDLDSLYMSAVVAMTGQGGWPMSVFLTPQGAPFYGGTYFPPVRRYNMPAFIEVLQSISQAWKTDRDNILDVGQKLVGHLLETTQLPSQFANLEPNFLHRAAKQLIQTYDHKFGGWGQAPKFPQPMAIEFLFTNAAAGDTAGLSVALNVLDAMAKGGMYDVVGGGFARYSTDIHWLVPHFEKMLYDNAQLASVYLYGYLISGNPKYKMVCEDTLNFVLRELTHPQGGFYSSLDADSEGKEGEFYLWELDEIHEILGAEAELFIDAYGITSTGNFEGKTILQRKISDEDLAKNLRMASSEVSARLQSSREKLLTHRNSRTRPGTDDKTITAWNGLMLVAFAEAGRYLNNPTYIHAAQRNASFLVNSMLSGQTLFRSWRGGVAKHEAYLEDYASLVLGLLALYQVDFQNQWFATAKELTQQIVTHFYDPQSGFFDTRDDHENLVVRPRDIQDNATPSGNALATLALMKMAAFTGNSQWHDLAETNVRKVLPTAVRYPTAFSKWLTAASLAINPIKEIAIVWNNEDFSYKEFLSAVNSKFRPHSILAASQMPILDNSPEVLRQREPVSGKTTAYICSNFICKKPTTSLEEFRAQLDR